MLRKIITARMRKQISYGRVCMQEAVGYELKLK